MTSFETLRESAEKAEKIQLELQESSGHLSQTRHQGWAYLLTSLATSEAIENLILEPLQERFAGEAELHSYLMQHGRDEMKHYRWLTDYAKNTFNHVRRDKTLSDVILYDGLLTQVGKLARNKPVYLFSLMYFYEVFTLHFYKVLRREAQKDDLQALDKICETIEKDERRHCASAKMLIQYTHRFVKSLSLADILGVQALLALFRLDMATQAWAFHNRRVRRSTLALNISVKEMTAMAQAAQVETLRFLQQEKSC